MTLRQIIVHVGVETARHAGHADIVRELIDSAVGMRPGDANVTGRTSAQWEQHRARVEEAAREAAGG